MNLKVFGKVMSNTFFTHITNKIFPKAAKLKENMYAHEMMNDISQDSTARI